MNDKEKVLSDFLDMIFKSWTYAKMTQVEKDRFIELVNNTPVKSILKGNYLTRWYILLGIYDAYLMGIGYDNFNWREDEKVL